MAVIGDVKGKAAVILDDMADTAGTLATPIVTNLGTSVFEWKSGHALYRLERDLGHHLAGAVGVVVGIGPRPGGRVDLRGGDRGDAEMGDAVLGSELAMMLVLSGHWNAIAKLENLLPKLEESLDM